MIIRNIEDVIRLHPEIQYRHYKPGLEALVVYLYERVQRLEQQIENLKETKE